MSPFSPKGRVERIAKKLRLPKGKAVELARQLFDEIAESVANGNEVEVPKFGVFHQATTKPHYVRNPLTGVMMPVGRSYRLGFRSSKYQRRTAHV